MSGSLLVCRIDSPWMLASRLYLTLNDPPERVMREQQRTGEEGDERGEEEQTQPGRKMRFDEQEQRIYEHARRK